MVALNEVIIALLKSAYRMRMKSEREGLFKNTRSDLSCAALSSRFLLGLGNNSSPLPIYTNIHFANVRQKAAPDVHFTNNAQMVYDHPALIRSSGSGLSAFCPTPLIKRKLVSVSENPKNLY